MSSTPIRLVCFDVDGTLVGKTIFVWQTLHDFFRTDSKLRKRAYDDYFARRITYREWFDWDIRLLREKGLNQTRMMEAIAGLELMTGARETLGALRDAGFLLAVVSGSLNPVLSKFDLERCFDDILINKLTFDDSGELVGSEPTPFDLEKKADGLDYLMKKYHLKREETAFVGDNFNDVSIAGRAGLSFAFNSTCKDLIDIASVVVEGTDLRAILPHLGIGT